MIPKICQVPTLPIFLSFLGPVNLNFSRVVTFKPGMLIGGFDVNNLFLHVLSFFCVSDRVARWFVSNPKIPIWVNFGGHQIGKNFICYGHWEYFMDMWDILRPFYIHLVHFSGFGILHQ
jgi:hypothetical protein